jgi:glutamyl-tRNA synthetase
MSTNPVRVRFAPSPTGGLHLGGVRTVLYNYLFARQHGGTFVLRIEDTDQSRFVEGAEQYIFDCLNWCGLVPDESTVAGGEYGPYRQSERKETYKQYAIQLVQNGHAYYAFDTPEELDEMRTKFKTADNPSPQYSQDIRQHMRNSISLSEEEVSRLLETDTPYVIRIKMPHDEVIGFTDLIRGPVNFNTSLMDDKVLLKADGMPTYHLAVVVDDYLMKITHAFRGEEWLPSAPVHLLLWKFFGWEEEMPQWAHLPLILGPDGAKLSKRHGNKYGFPIFAMNWTDQNKNELTEGFKERGFLPEAFINLLAALGWNDGTDQEIYSLEELIKNFSIEKVHQAGAQFDYEKAKWFNHQWIQKLPAEKLLPYVQQEFEKSGITINKNMSTVVEMVKERCFLLPDFIKEAAYFFQAPQQIDTASIKQKWTANKAAFFDIFCEELITLEEFTAEKTEALFKNLAAEKEIKAGEVLLPFRIMLVGGKFGPAVFDIATVLGKEEVVNRVKHALSLL